MPGCWPTVVWRSAGRDASGHGPDDTSGYHPARVHLESRIRCASRVSRCSTGPRRWRRCRASRPRSAAASRSGSSARTSCRSRSVATSCATSSSSSAPRWPRAPTTLVTSGRRWSNHARLTAAAGAKAGLAVHLVLSGPPVDPPNPGVRLDELLGATVHQAATDDRAERAALVERVEAELRAAGRRPYLVAIGGTGIVGAVGQVLAGLELAEGAASVGLEPDTVVVPSATGGTQAGLAGRASHGRPDDRGPWRRRHAAGAAAPGHRGDRHASSASSTGWPPSTTAEIVLDGSPARRRLRPADRGGRRGDPPAGPDRGDPRRSDLHGQGPGRPHRPGPRRARSTASRSSSGTPAGHPACSNRSTADRCALWATPRPTATRRAA